MVTDSSCIPQQLVGFWKIKNGDYKLVNEYQDTGIVIQYINGKSLGPSRFAIAESVLTVYVTQKNGDVFEFSNEYTLTENTLIFVDDGNSTRKFVRVKDEKGASLTPWWKIW